MAATKISCLLLLYTRTCHSFVTSHNNIVTTGKSMPPSLMTTCHAKEGEEEEQYEWDGVVVEGAHDDEFDSVDDEDTFVPSIGFMSMAASIASPALTAIGTGGGAATSGFDPLKNAGILHTMSVDKDGMSEDELIDMGGDPAFLDDDEDENGEEAGLDDTDFFEWDGSVDEDAHLDFDE